MGSPFVSQHTETIDLPFDPGQTATIRPLSGKEYEKAQFDHMTAIATGHGRNWVTQFVKLAGLGLAQESDAKKIFADPLSGFDRVTLVKCGLKGWSYINPDKTPKPVTEAAIEDLDDEALDYFAMAVLKLTKPARFQTSEVPGRG